MTARLSCPTGASPLCSSDLETSVAPTLDLPSAGSGPSRSADLRTFMCQAVPGLQDTEMKIQPCPYPLRLLESNMLKNSCQIRQRVCGVRKRAQLGCKRILS